MKQLGRFIQFYNIPPGHVLLIRWDTNNSVNLNSVVEPFTVACIDFYTYLCAYVISFSNGR